jgi:hypothetical protein
MEKIISRLWPYLVLAVYLIVNIVLILHHENWRDEAQAWQIAKQCSLKGMFAQLKYEGHPCLWYLILMPFAKLGFPFAYMGFISLFFMGIAVWLILTRAPFSAPVKIFIVFGSSFIYYYPVISRSYCLIPPILACLAVLYPHRKEKPLLYGTALAFLTQTHIFVIGTSFVLSAVWGLEFLADCIKKRLSRKEAARYLAGLGLSLMSALFLICELAGSISSNNMVEVQLPSSLHSNLHRINAVGNWTVNGILGMGLNESVWKWILLFIALNLILLIWFSWKEGLIFTGIIISRMLMFAYIYLPSHQKSMILMHELIFILWIVMQKKGKRKLQKLYCGILLSVLSIASIDGYYSTIAGEMTWDYSSSKKMAAYIQESVPEDAVIITTSDSVATAAAAYLDERVIWYPVTETAITYSVWDDERKTEISYEEMVQRIRKEYPDAVEIYILCGESSNITDLDQYLAPVQPLYEVEAVGTDESASLYCVEL